ncbi:MAG: hypothetical protein ACLSVG_09150 [Clostridia bacterium]
MKLSELQSQVKNQNEAQHMTLAVLSNVTFEPYFQLLLNKSFAENNIYVSVVLLYYSEFLSSSITEQIAEADIVAVIPNFEGFYPETYNKVLTSDKVQLLIDIEMSNMQNIISIIRSKSNASIVWFEYEDYCCKGYSTVGNTPVQNGLVDKLNLQIVSQMKSDIVYVDMKRRIANIGIANAYDNKNKYRWNSPYSQAMIEQICNEAEETIAKTYIRRFIQSGRLNSRRALLDEAVVAVICAKVSCNDFINYMNNFELNEKEIQRIIKYDSIASNAH